MILYRYNNIIKIIIIITYDRAHNARTRSRHGARAHTRYAIARRKRSVTGKIQNSLAEVGMQFNDCARLVDPAPSIQTVTRIMHFYRPARGCRTARIYFPCSVSLTGSKPPCHLPSCYCRHNRLGTIIINNIIILAKLVPLVWLVRSYIHIQQFQEFMNLQFMGPF